MQRLFLVGCVVLLAGSSARAEVLPTFHPTCSYRATHVVVVTTEPGGGRFKVASDSDGWCLIIAFWLLIAAGLTVATAIFPRFMHRHQR